MEFKYEVMDEAAIGRAITRISHEIIEQNDGANGICIIGIMRRGVALGQMISKKLKELGVEVNSGTLDITLYRDDISSELEMPKLNHTNIDFDITGKTIVMVDDVLYTGRTARTAMDALISLGRPQKIQFAVLIDRGHRELPIRADYVGKNIPTSRSEKVVVSLPPFDEVADVKLYKN